MALAVYQHGAVNPMGSGAAPTGDWSATRGSYASVSKLLGGRMPSYVAAKGFASALLDAVQNRQQPTGFIPDLKASIDAIPDAQLKAVLQGFYERAGGDVGVLHQNVATWFDHAMDRLSGDYKRWSQWVGLLAAAALTVFLDVDAVAIATHMYVDPALVQHVSPLIGDPQAAFALWSGTFPFGWDHLGTAWGQPGFWTALLRAAPGWLVTVAATLFGAPFWFDVLKRFVQIRGAGPDADEKQAKV